MSNYAYENYTYGRLYEVLEPYKDKGTVNINNGINLMPFRPIEFEITVIDNIDWGKDISYGIVAKIKRENETAVLLFNDVLCIVESFAQGVELKSLQYSNRDVNIPALAGYDYEDRCHDRMLYDLLDVLTETKHDDEDEEEEMERGIKMETTQEAYRMSNSLYKEFYSKDKELKKLFYDKNKYNKAKEVLYDDICTKYQGELATFVEYYLMDNPEK